MDWEFTKIVADLENAKRTLNNLSNSEYRREYIAKYLNGYELDQIGFNAFVASIIVDRIIGLLKVNYERRHAVDE